MKAIYMALLMACSVWALKGQVVDEKGVPVAGISVEVLGQSKKTTTGALGNFSFENLVSVQAHLLDNQLQFQNEMLLLNLKESSQLKLTWLNSKGQKLNRFTQDYSQGEHSISLKSLSPQTKGVYFLDVQINKKAVQAKFSNGQLKKVFSKVVAIEKLELSGKIYETKTEDIFDLTADLGQITINWNAIESGIQTGDFTKMGSDTAIIESVLQEISSRDSLLIASRARLFDLNADGTSNPGVSLDSLDWWPTTNSQLWADLDGMALDRTIQVLTTNHVFDSTRTLYSKNLAFLGIEPSPYFVIGGNPIYNATRGDTVNAQMMTFMENVFEWLLDEDGLSGSNKKIAISHMGNSEETAVEKWLLDRSDSLLQITKGCSADSLATCLSKDIDLLVVASDDMGGSDYALYANQIHEAMNQGLPVLYMVRTGSNKNLAKSLNPKLQANYHWHNYWKHLGLMSFNPTVDNSSVSGFDDITKVLEHLKNEDYNFDWSACDGNSCSDVVGFQEEFLNGIGQLRNLFTGLDKNNTRIFEAEGNRYAKYFALLGDYYRSQVTFPMDKDSTDDNEYLKSFFADYTVYQSRQIQAVQADLGNFSRSDFSHITPVTRELSYTSKRKFRAAGVYMIPGQLTRVIRKDSSATTTKVVVNSLRSASTKEYETNKYIRPKYLKGQSISIAPGDTIYMTSPYGGPLHIEYGTNGHAVRFEFQNIGLHPIWRSNADDKTFTDALAAGDYDWAEIITDGFEVHSQLEKMRTSIQNERFPSAALIAGATEKYVSNLPHVLAGFKGPGIDSVPEIHAFAEDNGLSIEFIDIVKHMNADQPTCGAGCSGNPYDAGWSFNPTGHGDIHELGHGLEKGKFKFSGWEGHSTTNYYSYFSKSRYLDSAGGASDCQKLKFEELYNDLQASLGETDPFTYMNTKDYSSWNMGASIMIQMFMMAEQQAVVSDGWYLLSRLHIIERAYGKANDNETNWDSLKVGMGFDKYAYADIGNITQNDWLAIALSKSMERNLVDYLQMWGILLSSEAIAQIQSMNYPVASRTFFGANDADYCTEFQPSTLPLDGSSTWPVF